jgi:hypothetical protein
VYSTAVLESPRMISHMFMLILVFVLLSYLPCVRPEGSCPDSVRQGDAMHNLFKALDVDGDGQIKSIEALKYLKNHWRDESVGSDGLDTVSRAFIAETDTDGAEEGQTVSEAELQRALSSRLQVCRCYRTHW